MSEMKNRYKAKISGKTYTVIGGESKSHMDIVTEIANRQLLEIQQIAPETSTENAAILLGINAISDQLKKERKIMALESEISELKKELALIKGDEELHEEAEATEATEETTSQEK